MSPPLSTEPTPQQGGGPHPAPNLDALFDQALEHHRADRLQQAETLYRQILAVAPRHADSLHLLGMISHRKGHHDVAVALIRQAIAAHPDQAVYHANLGIALGSRGQPEAAVACFRRAIELHPDFAEAHNNLGIALRQLGRLQDAVACHQQALRLRPDNPQAYNSLGIVLREQDRLEEAAAAYRRCLELAPEFADGYNNLGTVLRRLEQIDDAIACHRKALALRPDFPEALNNLGTALRDQGRADAAIVCLRQALDLKPDLPEAHNNLGAALRDQGRLDEAAASHRKALALRPDFPEALNNLGAILAERRRMDEAVACYRRAIDVRPDFPDARNNLAMALLAQGDMAEGWQQFEWRWQTPQLRKARRDFPQPQWRGEDAAGRTLLIHAEQGFGDTLQFCRFAPMAAARGLRVTVEAPEALVRLLRGLPGVERVLPRGADLPPFDLHCPMLSLPAAFATTVATIPGATYLRADPADVAAWHDRLDRLGNPGCRVGLVWAGNPRAHQPSAAAIDRRRSLPPERLSRLLETPGLQFFTLQKGDPRAPAGFPLVDLMDQVTDFADTGALISHLDLVISVDTAVAHLAAALGKPVWLLDRFDNCWRWLLGRRDSPWYPTLRLYRQASPGDWTPVLREVEADLRRFPGA